MKLYFDLPSVLYMLSVPLFTIAGLFSAVLSIVGLAMCGLMLFAG